VGIATAVTAVPKELIAAAAQKRRNDERGTGVGTSPIGSLPHTSVIDRSPPIVGRSHPLVSKDCVALSYPVAPQARNDQVVRLHLHRRPARPVAEGQSSCPDEQIVAATTQVRADPAEPDHARLVSLLPACSSQTHHELPGEIRVAQGDSLVPEAAPLEWKRCPPTSHRSAWPVDQTFGGRDRTLQPGLGTHHAGTATGATRSPTPGRWHTPPDGRCRGEPAAWKHARRVRRAAWGKGTDGNISTAPQADSTTCHRVRSSDRTP
jgi:hypothetical protein